MRILCFVLFCFVCNGNILSQNEDEEKLQNYFQKGYSHYYNNNDSLYYYFDKAKVIAKELEDYNYLISIYNIENWAATNYNDFDKIKKNFDSLNLIFEKHKSKIDLLPDKLYYESEINYTKGVYHFELQNFKKSRFYFEIIVNNKDKKFDSLIHSSHVKLVIGSYNYLAKMFSDENKYNQAKELYFKGLRTIKNEKDTSPFIEDNNNINILLAEIYQKQNHYQLANTTILKVLDYYINVTKKSNRIISSYQNIVSNHIKLKQLDSAKFYLNKMKVNLPKEHPFWYRFYEASSNIYEAQNNYPEAEKELQTALELIKQNWKNQPHNDIAEAYNKIGLLHAKFNHPEKALENYNLALQQFSKNVNPSTINQTAVLKILKNKAQVLNTLANTSESIKTVNQAVQTLDALKPSFKNNSDKLFLMEEAFPVFESGLEATYNLYQKTKQDSLIDKAFFYAEKSKSALLLEALLSAKATTFANIPKDITEKEQLLKFQINRLEKELNDTKNDKQQDELFQLKSAYRVLITTIETDYKSYYNLKYNSQVVSVSQLQDQLKPEDVLLSYFYGNNAIYSIAITKNSKSIQQFKTETTLENEIIAIYQMLNNPKSDLKNLNSKTYNLYKKLVALSLVNLQQKNLIIVADGLLNYIPFASLNTNPDTTKYLVEDYAISYVNSATLLKQLIEKKGINNKVLAFAPSFNTASSNLLPLPNNKAEATTVLNYFKGKTLTSNQATLKNFNTESSKYGILHFATHAILNDESPEYSYLAFQPNKTNNNLLYVSDLYNLNLNTNLVTLSACESGIGNLKRGEGFMSLARGFYFSGASSISSTLWKINDASALSIMDAFYKNLSKSDTKNSALQKAQLAFLNTNKQNALVHPYYWSGFVISGNTTALVSSSNLLWYLLGATIFVLIGVAFRKRRKSN